MALVAVPFFIAFAVQFIDGKDEWADKNYDILPGDLMLYGGLIFVNFSWVFFVVYYSMTLTAKTYDRDIIQSQKQIRKSESKLHIDNGNGLDNRAFDDSQQLSSDEELNF